MSKQAKTEVKSEAKAAKPVTVPVFKTFIRSLVKDGIPRGLKVAKNEVGGYTFTSGPKNARVSVIASQSELAEYAISMLGLKLPKAS